MAKGNAMGYPKEYSDEDVTPKRESPNTSPAGRQRAATLGTPVKKLSQAVLPPQKRYHQFYDGGAPDHDSDPENGDDDDYLSDEEVERRNAFNASISGTYSPTSSSSSSNVRAYGLDPAPYSSKTRLPKAASSSSAASGIRSPPLRDSSSGGGGFSSDDRFFQEMENLKLSGSGGSNASTSASGTSSRSASQLIDLDWASPPPSSSSSSTQKPLPQFPQQPPLLLQPQHQQQQQQPTFNLPQTPTSAPASLYSTPTPLYPFGSAASSGNPFIIPQPQSPPPSQQQHQQQQQQHQQQQSQQQHQASDLAIQEQQQLFLQQQHALLQQQLLQQQLLLQQQQYAAQMLKQQGSLPSSDDGMTLSPSNGARSRAQTVSPNWKPASTGGDYPSYFPTSTTTPTSPLSQGSQMQLLQPQQQQHMGQQQPISPTSSNAWMYQ